MGQSQAHASTEAVRVTNPRGSSPFVLVCDHASNSIPTEFGSLGLTYEDLQRHIAWDPGALPVCRRLSEALDAVLIESRISRLVIDCNRPLDAPDLIAPISETTAIPGNAGIEASERARRIALAYEPYHGAIDEVLAERRARQQASHVIAVHSFNPVYKGVARPWHVGVIHDEDQRLAAPLIAALRERAELVVGVNEPYSPVDRVYFTLERHARPRGLACVMIEIRNDEIADEAGQRRWAAILIEAIGNLPGGVAEAGQG